MGALPPSTQVKLQPVTYTPKFESTIINAVAQIEQSLYPLIHATLELNCHGATDSAEVILSIANNPDFSVMFERNESNADMPVYISIFSGFVSSSSANSKDISQLSLRFFGIVDIPSASHKGGTITFRCRSIASTLVDFPVTALVMNQTSEQLINSLANITGMTPNVQLVNPAVTVQQVFAAEFVGGSNFAAVVANVKAWDLLLRCAMFDDADVWVSWTKGGQVFLNYASPSLIKRTTVDLVYGRDLMDLEEEHSIQYAKNIRVEVHTYQKRIKQATTHRIQTDPLGGTQETVSSKTVVSSPVFGTTEQIATSTSPDGITSTTSTTNTGGPATAVTSPGSESAKERYVRFIPNLTPQMCQQLARAIWRQISMMEYRQKITLPMTKDLLSKFDITMLLNVTGSPYKNANSVFSGPNNTIVNTATASFAGASTPVVSNQVVSNRQDVRYWPRRITETIDPKGQGWYLVIDSVNHSLPQGSV